MTLMKTVVAKNNKPSMTHNKGGILSYVDNGEKANNILDNVVTFNSIE